MCDVAPVPTTPPCGTPALRTALDEGLACLRANCSTMPGSENGQTTSTQCAQTMCIGQVGALITSPEADALRCYGCLASSLPTETFASMRTACQTNPRAGLAYGGRNGVMILSKYPLSEVETRVVPGTWNQRVIMRATATLPNSKRVTVFCNHLTPQFDSTAFPYTGRHGCGRVGREGWAAEQLAQSRALVQWVNQVPSTTPVVVLGDFNTSPMSSMVRPEAVETYDYLRTQLTPAIPAGYTPTCTFCNANYLTLGSDDVWLDHVFLKNLPVSAVRSFSRTFTEPTVAVPTAPNRVPLSDHYGVRAVLTLP